jgi:hypothetical protein
MIFARRIAAAVVPCGMLIATIVTAADAPTEDRSRDDKRALAGIQSYVGEWRSVGQPKRGSNQGAWTEQSTWAWHFDGGRAELTAELTGNKYFAKLQLQAGDMPGEFILLATPPGQANADKPRRFTGNVSHGAVVMTADEPQASAPGRLTFRLVAGGDRMLVLYEKGSGQSFTRLAEVGSTRKGSSFARAGANGPECVVTGGLGTIVVEHEGKKYYVCCGGCRDYFLENPAAVLAEFRERKAAEQSK